MFTKATPAASLTSVLFGFVLGVAAALYAESTVVLAFLLFAAFIFSVIATASAERSDCAVLVAIFVLGIGGGMLRVAFSAPGASSIAFVSSPRGTLTGIIATTSYPNAAQALTLDHVTVDGTPYADRVLVTAPPYPRLPPGAGISLACTLKSPEPFDTFRYDRFLATRAVYKVCQASDVPLVVDAFADTSLLARLRIARANLVLRIGAFLPEPHATLLSGLLFGVNDFSLDWKARFVATGTSHIVAASGYNVSVVAKLLLGLVLAVGLSRRRAFVLLIFGLAAYVILAGAEAAVVRAAVMGALILVAGHIGRATSMRNIVLLTATVMLAVTPSLLRDDVGFQLSMLSTIGLLALAAPIAERLQFIPKTLGLRESFASTLAATTMSLPVLVLGFGRVSLLSPFVNLLVLPLLPYAMLAGGAMLGASAVSLSAASALALPTWTLLSAVLAVIRGFAAVPFGSVIIASPFSFLALCIALCGTLCAFFILGKQSR